MASVRHLTSAHDADPQTGRAAACRSFSGTGGAPKASGNGGLETSRSGHAAPTLKGYTAPRGLPFTIDAQRSVPARNGGDWFQGETRQTHGESKMIFLGLLQIGLGIAFFLWMTRENHKATEALLEQRKR